MTSTDIYSQTIPYFYIIQHKETRILYAGSRWAKGCHPDEFMQPNGYTTSSDTINSIIDQDGLNSFEILRIDTNLDGLHPYEYETSFLQCLDCASSPDWYNGHNNSGINFGTIYYKNSMIKKYGVEHNSQLETFKLNTSNTRLKRYGDANYNNRDKAKETTLEKYGDANYRNIEKSKETKIEKYGDANYNNRDKAKETKIEKYGDANYTNRDKAKETTLEKYGYNNPFCGSEFKEKSKETKIEKYGDANYNNRDKAKETTLEKYGAEFITQTDLFKEKAKLSMIDKTGYDNPAKVPFLSIIEKRKTYNRAHITRYYNDLVKYY